MQLHTVRITCVISNDVCCLITQRITSAVGLNYPDLSSPRWLHGCGLVDTDESTYLLVAGGQTALHSDPTASVEILPFGITSDIKATSVGVWASLRHLNVQRFTFPSVGVISRKYLVVAGGARTSSEVLKSVEVFDEDTQRWTLLKSELSVARGGHSTSIIDAEDFCHNVGTTDQVGGDFYFADD